MITAYVAVGHSSLPLRRQRSVILDETVNKAIQSTTVIVEKRSGVSVPLNRSFPLNWSLAVASLIVV